MLSSLFENDVRRDDHTLFLWRNLTRGLTTQVGGYGLHGGEECQARKRMISKREYKLRGSSSAGLEVGDSISDPQWYYGRDVLSGCSHLPDRTVCPDARATPDMHDVSTHPRFVYYKHLLGCLWWNKCELK